MGGRRETKSVKEYQKDSREAILYKESRPLLPVGLPALLPSLLPPWMEEEVPVVILLFFAPVHL